MTYWPDQGDGTESPSEAAGSVPATGAAASSIRKSTWPYKRHADKSLGPRLTLRPLNPPDASTDPTIDAINTLQDTMQQVARATRLVAAPWLIMPPDGESFHLSAGIAMPAVDGNYHGVLTVVVPPGRNGVLNKLANVVVGGAWNDFSGDAIWRLLRNPGAQVSAGVWTPSNAIAERNYQNIQASLGLVAAPAPIDPIRVFENDVLVLAMQNVALPSPGPEVGALLGGFFYPRTWDDQFDARDASNAW